MPPKFPFPDQQYNDYAYRLSELKHCYGPRVHLLSDPLLLSLLAKLCAPQTLQPLVNELVTTIYSSLLEIVINEEFPRKQAVIPTRMAEFHPEAVYQGPIIDPDTPVISVGLARAGTLPSHICYTRLNYLMNAANIRQDHISIARTVNPADAHVTGSSISGHKIGGTIDKSIVLFPDPMGATGNTLIETIGLFKKWGKPSKMIAMNCIITPEYLKKVLASDPEIIIYSIRLDRGFSPPEVLRQTPGAAWELERGLNEKQYIVPGGGGFGEIMNNAYV